MLKFALLNNDALQVHVHQQALSHVEHWFPFSARPLHADDASPLSLMPKAVIKVVELTDEYMSTSVSAGMLASAVNSIMRDGTLVADLTDSLPTLKLAGVNVYIDQANHTAILRSESKMAVGTIDLENRVCKIFIKQGAVASRHSDVSVMLTVGTALLMNRSDHALMHSAAVAPPGGDAWLLVGDTHSGKTTTTANVISAGWNYCSDDHVVLGWSDVRNSEKLPTVEGWPRTFHLDSGWGTNTPQNIREDVDPRQFKGKLISGVTVLAGVLLPVVDAGEPTRLVPVSKAQALAAIVRQSPWLMGDTYAAPRILELLKAVSSLRSYQLRLGLDTFNNPQLLHKRLAVLSS